MPVSWAEIIVGSLALIVGLVGAGLFLRHEWRLYKRLDEATGLYRPGDGSRG